MIFKHITLLTAAGIMLAACHSNGYKISGQVEGLADGDTLFLTSDLQTGMPSDTIVVRDGKFSFQGAVDSVHLAMIYSAARNEINAPFFVEPGEVTITLSDTPGKTLVGGTPCNKHWQQLNDSVVNIGREINRIAEHVYGNTLTPEEEQQGMLQIQKLNQRFAALVVKFAKDNIDNEFGYFLLSYYPEEIIDNDTRYELISQLPDKLRQRPAIQHILKAIEAAAKTATGNTIKDFSQPSLDGTSISLMDEVRKNRITIIDFWASWCGPCRQEMPLMVDLYANYKDRGLGIVGISLDENHESWQSAVIKLQMTWPQMSDLKGWNNDIAKYFNITSIPHTILVDAQGKILQRDIRGEELRDFVKNKLAGTQKEK